MKYYLLTIIFSFIIVKNLSSQDSTLILNPSIPNTKGFEKDPNALVNKLIAGKNTDKEKFDAIFTWVTKNIRYDYYLYLSPQGATKPRVKQILKRKKGICVDYAYLMDTLCTIAGLRNVSVYGYAKDELFDVTDSIFYDNHAWNAVQLDNDWYAYDATWSSGRYYLDYSKFSYFIIHWAEKLYKKKKTRVIQFKTTHEGRCDTVVPSYRKTIEVIPLRNIILLKILGKIPLRVKLYFRTNSDYYFYLVEPEVLSITHYPDNPYWSLTNKYSNFRQFETDSAFYNYTDSVYIKQKRKSSTCAGCDNYFSLDEMEKQKEMKENSYKLNKRNKFITGECDYNIGSIFFKRAIPETDSTTKVNTLDSAIFYYSGANSNWVKARKSVSNEYTFLYHKNITKKNDLLKENRINVDYMYAMMGVTHLKTRKIKDFTIRSERSLKRHTKLVDKLSDIQKIRNSVERGTVDKKQLQLINQKLNKNNITIDSANTTITALVNKQSLILKMLADNMWTKIAIQDSLSKIFNNGSRYRMHFLNDNRKKLIVEMRKNIDMYKKDYSNGLSENIFTLSDSASMIGMQILNLINNRNLLFNDNINLLARLVNGGIIPRDSLEKSIQVQKDAIQENICWIVGGSSNLKSVKKGYKLLIKQQKGLNQTIKQENIAESKRYVVINRELNRRKRKFSHIAAANSIVANHQKGTVKKHKREYLKELKEIKKKDSKKN